ncbi:MAG: hypothetical protein ACRDOP_01310, partial [Gaiellaceae bacterium]
MRGFAWAASAVLLLAFAPGAALAAKPDKLAKPDKPAKVKPEKPEKAEAEAPGKGRRHGQSKGKEKAAKEKGRPPAEPAGRATGFEPKEVEQEAAAPPIVVTAVQKHAPVRLAKEPKAARGKVALCHATGSATNPFVLISVSVNATTGNGHGRHADDIIPVGDGSCARAQPDPVPEPEDPSVPPKDDPKPYPGSASGDEPRLPVSQPVVLAAEAVPAVQG